MKTINIIYILGCFVLLLGCDLINFKQKEPEQETEQPIARVYDKFLYPKDVKGIVTPEMSRQDSARRVSSYIKSWLQKQLLITEAEKAIEYDEAELERKILDYRYALVVHEFEKAYVNKNLDTTVTHSEIQQYYDDYQENFQLQQHIIKGYFVQLPNDAPDISRFKRLMRATNEKDQEEFKSYCLQYATNYHLNDSLWIKFDNIISGTPFSGVTNKEQMLKGRNFREEKDTDYTYLLLIKDYDLAGEIAPLAFVENQVRNIIVHHRRVDLAKRLEEDIYKRANDKNDIEIF
ncbi:peptidyl-prolyl cis-trans isomerase [Fulvivirgaceae bacterium BMA10]|uniref:Peptidyl-prolyl cis-trans isomerase n=1 Tax=Splendidivirga corallicola TaxID=3051826 RepID=A0ABT8KX72_9BACT|nr:peptidyl-prolyl cis-trans isomerase [Fulvivirgaceae bacterium BMA10]